MTKRILIGLLLICSVGIAKHNITLKFLESKPQGVVRDFYIWQFISNDKTSINEAIKAYDLVANKTPKIQQAMQNKGISTEMPKDIFCKSLTFDKLKNEDAQCISYGLKLSDIPKISNSDAKIIIEKISTSYPDLLIQIKVLLSKDILKAMFEVSAKNFGAIFNGLSYTQKLKIFDHSISVKKLEKLANENSFVFNKTLHSIILDPRFDAFKKALAKADIKNSDANTFFLLGINEILQKKEKKALIYFARSKNAAIDPFMRDRALFWQYLLSENKLFLEELSQSNFVDIFSIYANQKLGSVPKYNIISDFKDISKKNPGFDISDPFEWQILKENIFAISDDEQYKKILEYFKYEKTLPHLVYFLNRLNKYKMNYFIRPYEGLIGWKDDNEKAMVYAIARQESHLLPALISRSYALGIMQIMPFNVLPFAKEMNIKDISLFNMFDPKTSLNFGKYYLNHLKEEFVHPLFVSYAYNGGPGFLRRLLDKKELFLKGRKYEPWISMELIPYEESRFYGMKVLANYVIYQELLGHKIDLEKFLKQTIIYTKEKK
ncbi:transglycosylase SLT domain-containing protein [Helicobacter cappadocius]|uniref:Transglycosylase SLT domain-containing protein n=1 Tax=Helicobacter cappadocius TaxID=3063998 RepID=A0AA90Q2A3_9HELI|nr:MULTISPECIES: transglycosylase SLT domain-containing protein [unclassified Helicobacter]MDO7252845.1 transglycosylase SLT domain-containing protein [Helicobacter sp. faydin-H75]MDP2538888.1 transglycosylase SLT domain-containing protein [Helicobacter sp. faydin-H76]